MSSDKTFLSVNPHDWTVTQGQKSTRYSSVLARAHSWWCDCKKKCCTELGKNVFGAAGSGKKATPRVYWRRNFRRWYHGKDEREAKGIVWRLFQKKITLIIGYWWWCCFDSEILLGGVYEWQHHSFVATPSSKVNDWDCENIALESLTEEGETDEEKSENIEEWRSIRGILWVVCSKWQRIVFLSLSMISVGSKSTLWAYLIPSGLFAFTTQPNGCMFGITCSW